MVGLEESIGRRRVSSWNLSLESIFVRVLLASNPDSDRAPINHDDWID